MNKEILKCGHPKVRGGFCSKPGTKPDQRCPIHCDDKYKNHGKRVTISETLQRMMQANKENTEDMIDRVRAAFFHKLRDSEERMKKEISAMINPLKEEIVKLSEERKEQDKVIITLLQEIKEIKQNKEKNQIEKRDEFDKKEKESVDEYFQRVIDKTRSVSPKEEKVIDDESEEEKEESDNEDDYMREGEDLEDYIRRVAYKDMTEEEIAQDKETVEYMKKQQIERDRYIKKCQLKLSPEEKKKIKQEVEETKKEQGEHDFTLLPGEKFGYKKSPYDDTPQLEGEEYEKHRDAMYHESVIHDTLPSDYFDRFQLLFPMEKRGKFRQFRTIFPKPSKERDEKLMEFFERQYNAGIIDKVPDLKDVNGSTVYQPYMHPDNNPDPYENLSEEEKKRIDRLVISLPCIVCGGEVKDNNRAACPKCYKEMHQCKGLTTKGTRCKRYSITGSSFCRIPHDKSVDD